MESKANFERRKLESANKFIVSTSKDYVFQIQGFLYTNEIIVNKYHAVVTSFKSVLVSDS